MTADRPKSTQLGKDAAASTAQDAALRGAALAFGKPPVKPKPMINTYSGNNGALAAATKVGTHTKPASNNTSALRLERPGIDQRLSYQSTGGSTVSRANTGYSEQNTPRQRMGRSDGMGNGHLQPPGAEKEGRSQSLIAATLAASRSASTSPNHTGQQQPANMARLAAGLAKASQRSSSPARSVSSSRSSDHPLDLTPIPPTTSLIDMFEKNGGSSNNRPRIRRSITSASRRGGLSPSPQGSPLPRKARTPSPLPVRSRKPVITSPKPVLAQRPAASRLSEVPNLQPKARKPPLSTTKPIPIPSRPRSQSQIENEDDDASSDDSFVSASDYKPSFRAELHNQNRRLTSTSAVSVNSSVTVDS
ncbi:Increased rDNA silencing protein, partial [Lachnellula suecica]